MPALRVIKISLVGGKEEEKPLVVPIYVRPLAVALGLLILFLGLMPGALLNLAGAAIASL